MSGKYSEGGSTITQQLARQLFLTDQKTISRKLKEMILDNDSLMLQIKKTIHTLQKKNATETIVLDILNEIKILEMERMAT